MPNTDPQPAALPVPAPPAAPLPSVPNGFIPVDPADLRGYRPMQSEMAATAEALSELEDFTDYAALLGVAAPPADQLAARLRLAAEWTVVLSQSVAWTTYARSQQGIAWKEALQMMEKLKRPFELAAEANPALGVRYPGLARLLGASRAVGKRAAAARARKKGGEGSTNGGGVGGATVPTAASSQGYPR